MKIVKKTLKNYSKSLVKSLLNNLNDSKLSLNSDKLELNINKLKIRCNIEIDSKFDQYQISDTVQFYIKNLVIKINDLIYNFASVNSKLNLINKAQLKYIINPENLIVKINGNRKLYGIRDNNVTLIGDKCMYDINFISEDLNEMIYKTLKSVFRKLQK